MPAGSGEVLPESEASMEKSGEQEKRKKEK